MLATVLASVMPLPSIVRWFKRDVGNLPELTLPEGNAKSFAISVVK
jgi:hypothetical protein